MLFEVVFGAVLGGGAAAIGWVVRRAARDSSKTLPIGAGAPADRGEAVRRVLKHIERRTIAELLDGSAAVVEGIVQPIAGIAPLRSPFAGTACIGYHLDIRAAWVAHQAARPVLRDEARCLAFEVTDATGTIRVDAEQLALAITDAAPYRFNTPLHPTVAALVPRVYHGWSVEVAEGLLVPGSRVLVCGVAVREQAATDYRDGASTLTLRATATFPLVASTDADLFAASDRPIAPEELHRRR